MPFGFDPDSKLIHGWQAEPDSRGTWSILASCLTTMFLCIWSALHLNMPAFDDTAWHIGLRKTGWLICGLFAPELIVWTAFEQWREAKALTSRMRELLEKEGETSDLFSATEANPPDVESEAAGSLLDPKPPSRHPWTIVHSHYLLMGGFAFDASFSSQQYLPSGARQLKLMPNATTTLASVDPRLIPNISEDEISDKSKANSLAKTIVCLQASWFCVQCIGRLSQGIGVSLLELNTFAHAICALLVFLLWWDKPLDVGQPSLVQAEYNPELCAAMVMTDVIQYRGASLSFDVTTQLTADERSKTKLRMNVQPYLAQAVGSQGPETSQPPSNDAVKVYFTQLLPRYYGIKPVNESAFPPNNNRALKWFHSGRIPGAFEFYGGFATFATGRALAPSFRRETALGLSPADIDFLELARQGFQRYASLTSMRGAHDTYLGRRINEWPSLGSADEYGIYVHSLSLLVGVAVAGLVYGAMHLLAWSAPFTSLAELILWRSSAIILMSSGMVFGLTRAFGKGKGHSYYTEGFPELFFMFAYAIVIWFALAYVAARLFLVIECFLEMGHLPEEVYRTPKWTKYWPHIG